MSFEHLLCIQCGVRFDHGQYNPHCPACRVEHEEKPVGVKYDNGKPQWHLLEMPFVGEMVAILTFGAKKYAPDNWKVVVGGRDRYYDALMRHTNSAWAEPGSVDPEHGQSHWAAVAVNACFLWWIDSRKHQDD